MDKIYVSGTSTSTQTEQLTSQILWHCLLVVKTVPEFKSLSYRVTTDMNGNELLIISRDQVIRVFGPPVEPISLTIDPTGKCLLSIPFRRVQHVPITRSKTGHLDLTSVHALLQMVAGKEFYFCPGIPEKFLAGKACGKFVILHRTPFKRFNAVGCPVYFKLSKTIDLKNLKGTQRPIRTLCPRCRQVARWVQTLPVSQRTTVHTAVINPVPQGQILYPVPLQNQSSGNSQVKNLGIPVESKTKTASVSSPVVNSVPLTVLDNNANTNVNTSSNNLSNPEDFGKSITVIGLTGKGKSRAMTNEKLQAVSESLRQLLKQRSMTKDVLPDLPTKFKFGNGGQTRDEKSSSSHHGRSPRGDRLRKNVCRICSKQFSSNLRLSKHVQRHEGNTPNLSLVLRKKLRRYKASTTLLKSLFRGFTSHSFHSSNLKKTKLYSDRNLQLMLNSLDSLLLNEKKFIAGEGTSKNVREKKKSRGKRKLEEQTSQPIVENPAPVRPSMQRSGSGLAAVQTLLNAAQLADVDSKSSSLGNLHNNFPVCNGLTPDSSTAGHIARNRDSPTQTKKARQSSRLASKRANKKSKQSVETEASNLSLHSETSGTPSDESIMLTNLNLLSTVSLQAEMRDNQGGPNVQLLSYAGNPDSKMHNTSHNSVVNRNNVVPLCSTLVDSVSTKILSERANFDGNISRHQIPTTVISTEDSKSSKNALPPIPPLMLGVDNILMSQSHSSTSPLNPLPLTSSAVLQNFDVLKNNRTAGSNVNLLPREDVLGSNYGAMDLSKPKSIPTEDSASSGKSSPATSNSADVLRQLMMITPVSVPQTTLIQPESVTDRTKLLSSKEADDSLQARMFASAKNYKVDPSKLGHLQAVIASSSTPSVPNKPAKGKEKSLLPVPINEKSEIQCGYKWSGSGGLVKERTQLVRELVPSVVMANILSGPGTGSGLPKMDDPISASIQNITKLKGSDKQDPQAVAKSSQPPVSIQNSTAHHITLKRREAPVHPKTPQYVLNLSKNRNEQDAQQAFPSAAQLQNKSSPISFQASILKTSLLNTPSVLIPTSLFAQKPLVSGAISTTTGTANNKSHSKTSVLAPLRNTVLATLPTPVFPTSQPIPNSTLAAILRHSPKQLSSNLSSKNPGDTYSATVSSAIVPIVSEAICENTEVTQIKTEPTEILSIGKMPTVVSDSFNAPVVIKSEKTGTTSDDRDLPSPPNLVVDMGIEKGAMTSTLENLNAKFKSSKGKVSVVNTPLKCEFCAQNFRTVRSHEYHDCPKKPT